MAAESIHQRMAAILSDLPAIGKTQKNQQQGFMFRGHDDVMNALNPLLSKHQVFFVPDVLDRVTSQRTTSKGGVMYEVNLHVRFTFYGPQGDSVTASAWGEGTDSGDKSTNKAMTMALKNVIAQTFAVSTAENADTDGHTPPKTTGRTSAQGNAEPRRAAAEEAPPSAAPPANGTYATEAQRKRLFALAAENQVDGPSLKAIVERITGQGSTAQIPRAKYDEVCIAVQTVAEAPFV